MADVVARVPTLSFIDMSRVLVFATSRAERRRRAVRHVPLRVPSTQRAWLLLLARSPDRCADSPFRMVRHEVAGHHDRRGAHRLHGVVHAAALLRSAPRPVRASRRTTPAIRRGSPSSTRSCTSSTTSIPTGRASAGWSAPTGRARRTVTASASSRTSCDMVKLYLDTNPDPYIYDFLRCDFAGLTATVRRRGRARRSAASPRIRSATRRSSNPQPQVPGHDDCRVEPLKLPRVVTQLHGAGSGDCASSCRTPRGCSYASARSAPRSATDSSRAPRLASGADPARRPSTSLV